MKRGKPLKRKTPMARGTSELKRTEMKRSTTPIKKVRDKALDPRKTGGEGISGYMTFEQAKPIVRKRSGGRCEIRLKDCQGAHTQTHHRKLRRFGDHRPINLLGACDSCHTKVHAMGIMAYKHGWLLCHWQDPNDVPVIPPLQDM